MQLKGKQTYPDDICLTSRESILLSPTLQQRCRGVSPFMSLLRGSADLLNNNLQQVHHDTDNTVTI